MAASFLRQKIRQVAEKGDTAESVEMYTSPSIKSDFSDYLRRMNILRAGKLALSREIYKRHNMTICIGSTGRRGFSAIFWTMSVMTVFLCCSLQKFYPSADVLQIGKDCHSEICIISHSEKQAKQHWMRTARSLTGRGGGPGPGRGAWSRGGSAPGGGVVVFQHTLKQTSL